AKRANELLTNKYGLAEEDIIFDPLVFPCGTGDENYFGSGKETIDAVRSIKKQCPKCKILLGVSNVSFGLPLAGREVLNSVFLHLATEAGLDLAIVNAEKLVRESKISAEEKQLCHDLLWYDAKSGQDPIAAFVNYFRGKENVPQKTVAASTLSVEEKIKNNVLEGSKENLPANLDEALKKYSPLDVINKILLAGMGIVGEMFRDNKLIVAEVLQSAEVMKAAVDYLQQFIAAGDTSMRGTLLLATVTGDVHDIGKNLLKIIMENSGFKVIDLGIKCSSAQIIEAFKKQPADLIGLSGLLVKSVQQMAVTAGDLKAAGISVPLLLGGAALSENFTVEKIASEYSGPVVYCPDAMSGLDAALRLTDPDPRVTAKWLSSHTARQQTVLERRSAQPAQAISLQTSNNEQQATDHVLHAPGYDIKVIAGDPKKVWPYLKDHMLFDQHLGFKGSYAKSLAAGDKKAIVMKDKVEQIKNFALQNNLISLNGVYQFFKARSEKDTVIVFDPKTESELARFHFPRQINGQKIALSDFVSSNRLDSVCFFVVTSGSVVEKAVKELTDEGKYLDAQVLTALAVESVEAFAEHLHKDIRDQWGIPDQTALSKDDLFRAKYRGLRVSFGYPACPGLEEHAKLWQLLSPDKNIGVTLTESFMMKPEASISAMVLHHPEARYL
ncbi:MAG: vitamin B12 dependent-methionine synthase activation domain-containing protein, partial [Candidatus Margulisiibacteriota bacterium]